MSTEPETTTDEEMPERGVADGSGLETASPEDFFVTRDADGKVNPVKQRVPGRDVALNIRPMPTGMMENLYGENGQLDYSDNKALAKMFNHALADLDRELTAEEVENDTIGFGATPLVDCIERASGRDMMDALEQEQRQEMAEALGEENLEKLMSAAMDEDEEESQDGEPASETPPSEETDPSSATSNGQQSFE